MYYCSGCCCFAFFLFFLLSINFHYYFMNYLISMRNEAIFSSQVINCKPIKFRKLISPNGKWNRFICWRRCKNQFYSANMQMDIREGGAQNHWKTRRRHSNLMLKISFAALSLSHPHTLKMKINQKTRAKIGTVRRKFWINKRQIPIKYGNASTFLCSRISSLCQTNNAHITRWQYIVCEYTHRCGSHSALAVVHFQYW